MYIRQFLMASLTLWLSTLALAEGNKNMNNTDTDKVSLVFDEAQLRSGWQVINDVVMGGLSVSNVDIKNREVIFSGNISIENNGGFASVYKRIAKLPAEIKSVGIHIKGDGNPYQLRVRSRVGGYDVAYKMEFPTEKDTKQILRFNLVDFKATFRGRIINDAPTLKANTISHVGFLIAAQKSKIFTLSTYEIEFY